MSREKNGSLLYQYTTKLHSLKCFGSSRHQAKQSYKTVCEQNGLSYKQGQTAGIYSHATADAYRNSGAAFCGWVKIHHPEVRKLDDIKKEHAYEWLKAKEAEGQSAYTISRDMSAINKVIGLDLSKTEGGLHQRSIAEITRSRGIREHDSHYNPDNYKGQIAVAQAFGTRRESIYGGQYQIKDVSFYLSAEGHVRLCLIEKGGKYREAPCLLSHEDQIKEMFPNIQRLGVLANQMAYDKNDFIELYRSSENVAFERYTAKIDNHAIRGEYARELYQELAKGTMDTPDVPGYNPAKYNDAGEIQGYDKALVRQVSLALGHNRLSVAVSHYLRKN